MLIYLYNDRISAKRLVWICKFLRRKTGEEEATYNNLSGDAC